MRTDQRYANWFGALYGGSFVVPPISAAQQVVGSDYVGTHHSFHFLKSAMPGDCLHAEARIEKSGRTVKTVCATTSVRGRPIGIYTADYFRAEALVGRSSERFDRSLRVRAVAGDRPLCDFFFNAADAPDASYGLSLQELMCGKAPHVRDAAIDADFNGRACIGYHTNEAFADGRGAVDACLLGCIADNAQSLACRVAARQCVTTSLTLDAVSLAQSRCDVVCEAFVVLKQGPVMITQGTIWAGDRPLGTCGGSYCLVSS